MHTHQYANFFSAPVASYGSFVEKKKLFLHVGWKLVIIALIYDLHVNLRASYAYVKLMMQKNVRKITRLWVFGKKKGEMRRRCRIISLAAKTQILLDATAYTNEDNDDENDVLGLQDD